MQRTPSRVRKDSVPALLRTQPLPPMAPPPPPQSAPGVGDESRTLERGAMSMSFDQLMAQSQ